MGGVHGDAVREMTGTLAIIDEAGPAVASGVFARDKYTYGAPSTDVNSGYQASFAVSRVTPTAAKVAPRAWGTLACVYLGAPK